MGLVEEIRSHYNKNVEMEWKRIENRAEFLLTCRFMARYLKEGDRILDIGGGPGRYALHWARRGHAVTLLDLAEENARFAAEKARAEGLPLTAMAGDARSAAALLPGESFDHVFLMGPLYHLTEVCDRRLAVSQALALLKPGGTLYASFIGLFAGMIYFMKEAPALVAAPEEAAYLRDVLAGKSYGGPAFTTAHFSSLADARALMEGFSASKAAFSGARGNYGPLRRKYQKPAAGNL